MDEIYEAIMAKRRREEQAAAVKEAALSAGVAGGLTGAAHSLLNGNRSIPSILLRGLGGAALAAPAAAGATALGNAVMGAPSDNDPAAYTRRGGIGGAIGGTAIGGGLGYLVGSGRLRGLASMKGASAIGRGLSHLLPADNLLTDKLRKWAAEGGHTAGLKGAALLGVGLGGLASLHGSSEGMGVDAIRNLRASGSSEDDEIEMLKRRYERGPY